MIPGRGVAINRIDLDLIQPGAEKILRGYMPAHHQRMPGMVIRRVISEGEIFGQRKCSAVFSSKLPGRGAATSFRQSENQFQFTDARDIDKFCWNI